MEASNSGREPTTARSLAGLRQDGMPLYRCEACGRTLAKEAFGIRSDGVPLELCRRCEERQKRPAHGWAASTAKRSGVKVESKRCVECGETKDARFFWADTKLSDGLNKRCIACVKEHRRNMKVGTEEPWRPGRAARQLAEEAVPILDQAIAERDSAMRELRQLKQTLNGRDKSDAEMPDDMNVALARIEAMCASMAGEILNSEKRVRPTSTGIWFRRGLRRAADALARAAGELDRRAGGD